MAEYRVELTRRLLAAFPNLGSVGYLIGLNAQNLPDRSPYEDSSDLLLNLDAEDFGKSPFNTAHWDKISVQILPADPEEESERYEFPNDPLVDVFMRRKITETEVYGGPSVVEMSGLQCSEFRIRGVLWNNDGQYPEDQLADLLNVFRQDAEIEVISSRYFGLLNITSLVIESVGLPAIEGYSDSQPFVIQARETRPIVLDLRQ